MSTITNDWEPGADLRIVSAREFLDAARGRPSDQLPLSVLRREGAELRRLVGVLLQVIDDAPNGMIVPPRPGSKKAAAKARLLAELPRPAGPGGHDDAFATLLADRDDDLCDAVTGWLRAARAAVSGEAQ
jgi:hypothetical protein